LTTNTNVIGEFLGQLIFKGPQKFPDDFKNQLLFVKIILKAEYRDINYRDN